MEGGAIIVTAHEHSYSRTLTLNDIGNMRNHHGVISGDHPDELHVGLGETFSFVSGMGGKSERDFEGDPLNLDPWWAAIYTTNFWKNTEKILHSFDGAVPGALFITFHVDGDPFQARGEFIDILDRTIDSFEIKSTHEPAVST